MKNNIKILIASFLVLLLAWSCKKDENRDYLVGSTPPVVTAVSNSSGDSISMAAADSSKTAVSLTWTNPNYQFTTGISSQDVNYQVQIDTTGSNFTNPQKAVISVSKDMGLTITEAQLNDYMQNQLGLQVSMVHHIEIRVVATIGVNNAAPVNSTVAKFSATPYVIPPKVLLPSTGNLYLVGDATAGGWNNPVPVPSQEFTQTGPTTYEITVQLTGGKQYLFIPKNGDWSNKYACKSTSGQSPNGGDFGYNWSDNFPGPAATGTYKIVVDFQHGKYTVTQQ